MELDQIVCRVVEVCTCTYQYVPVKQKSAFKSRVRAALQLVGSQVHTNLENFSPCKRVPFDWRSRSAVAQIVRS